MHRELKDFEVDVLIHDPIADESEALEHYGITLAADEALQDLDGVIIAVGHSVYKAHGFDWIKQILKPRGIIVDVKGLYDSADFDDAITYWRL